MKNKMMLLFGTLCMLVALATLGPLSHKAFADEDDAKRGLEGSWAFQFTGEVNLPAPFNGANGRFYRNGRFVADKAGNVTPAGVTGNFHVTSATSNYNGVVGHETFAGTYILANDGTFHLTINNLPVPAFPPGVPNVFVFDGVLADNGKAAKVVLAAVSIFGAPQPNIGSVIAGEFLRQ